MSSERVSRRDRTSSKEDARLLVERGGEVQEIVVDLI
jgi:hypothetical protein